MSEVIDASWSSIVRAASAWNIAKRHINPSLDFALVNEQRFRVIVSFEAAQEVIVITPDKGRLTVLQGARITIPYEFSVLQEARL